jgi:dihydropteroate synthase
MPHRLASLLPEPAPWLMGVLNVTPDSFTDGGLFQGKEAAFAQASRMMAEGAAIIDIGGESTAPGSSPLPASMELQRIEDLVAVLAQETVLSVDTYHASTAERCLKLGARMINDVSALRGDPNLARVLAGSDAVLVMMYAKDGPLPHATERPMHYEDVVREVGDFLERQVETAVQAGIEAERIVLDPGMGRFVSLDPAHSFELLGRFEELVDRFAPIPLLIGSSRKGFLGVPLEERDPVSQLTATVAASKGATIVRTHDPAMARNFLETWRRMALPLPAADAG